MIKLQLVAAFFNINWQFHSTNLIIENELYDEQQLQLQPYIDNGKLIIQKLDGNDIIAIMEIQSQKPPLSDKDCSALHCAQKLNGALVTSDNTLRRFAKVQNVEVWAFMDFRCLNRAAMYNAHYCKY